MRGGGRRADDLLQFLPSGMTLFSDHSFNTAWSGSTPDNGWIAGGGATYTTTGQGTITTPVWKSESSGGYGPGVARIECPEGSLGGTLQQSPPSWTNSGGTGFGSWETTENAATNLRRMYFAIRCRFSPGYVIHNSDEKFVYPTYHGSSPTQVPLTGFRPSVNPSTDGVGPARITAIYYGENPFNAPVSEPCVPMGEWVTICYDMLLNTPESANGHLKVWVNGPQYLDKTNWLAYTGTNQLGYKTMRLTSVRGGGDAAYPVPSGGMWREYDRVVLYYGVS
jgi:hypothetical protein